MFLKYIMNVTLALLLVLTSIAGELMFTNEKENTSFVINEDGSVVANLNAEEQANLDDANPTISLQFKYSGSKMMNLDNEKVRFKKDFVSRGKYVIWPDYYDEPSEVPLSFRITEETTPRSILTNDGSFIRDFSEEFTNVKIVKQPNFVRNLIFQDSEQENPIVSTSYSDGFGRIIQEQHKLNTCKSIVSGRYYDQYGSLKVSTLSAPLVTLSSYLDMDNNVVKQGIVNEDKLLQKINDFYMGKYPEEGRYAYAENEYDPNRRFFKSGFPGETYNLENGHEVSNWIFGIETFENFEFIQFSSVENLLTEDPYDIDESKFLNIIDIKSDDINAKYFLNIKKDENDNFVQSITDIKGHIIKRSSFLKGQLICSGVEYDVKGRIVKEHSPNNNVASSFYCYNTANQIVRSVEPDRGLITFNYNINNSLKSKKDSRGNEIEYDYDLLGRMTRIYEGSVEHVLKYYDDVSNIDSKFPNVEGLSTVLLELQNIKGKKFAEVAFSNGRYIIDIFSYNVEGDISQKYKLIEGLEWQKIEYEYTLQGNISKQIIRPYYLSANKIVKPIVKHFEYDKLNRIVQISLDDDIDQDFSDDKVISTFEYDDMDLIAKNLHNGNIEDTILIRREKKNIRDWLNNISYENKVDRKISFEEQILYDDGIHYDGTITGASYEYEFSADAKKVDLEYYYGQTGKLDSVKTKNNSYPDYHEAFEYDISGRILKKVKGKHSLDESDPEYVYQTVADAGINSEILNEFGIQSTDNINRLNGFSNDNDRYSYDKNGNRISDVKKDLNITYDWRNLPIKIELRNSYPNVDYLIAEMSYDASGNRVSKKIKTTEEHLEHIYSEGRLTFLNDNLDVVDPIFSGYELLYHNVDSDIRVDFYDEVNERCNDTYVGFKYCLKDHLGSTRMLLSDDGSVNSAEWYYAFGEIENLVDGPLKQLELKKKFTDKEFDNEGANELDGLDGIGLYYFGARYYDPEVGQFISPDPLNEFWNLYSYVGEDPINNIDPDGMQSEVVFLTLPPPVLPKKTVMYFSEEWIFADAVKQVNDDINQVRSSIKEYRNMLMLKAIIKFLEVTDVITIVNNENAALNNSTTAPNNPEGEGNGTPPPPMPNLGGGEPTDPGGLPDPDEEDKDVVKDEEEPTYENPGHHDPSNVGPNKYNPTKSTLPKNHKDLWNDSKLASDGNRWTKVGTGKKAVYHRFQNSGNNTWHWNGSTKGATKSGIARNIRINNVPKEVIRW